VISKLQHHHQQELDHYNQQISGLVLVLVRVVVMQVVVF
jgi:hypothetical protein